MQQLEPDLRPHAEYVAELDVEVRERLEESGVLEGSRVERVEADVSRVLERLLNLPDQLNATAETTSRALDETAGRIATTLQETVPERIDRSTKRMVRATRRLTQQQHALAETERSLAYTIERLRRQPTEPSGCRRA